MQSRCSSLALALGIAGLGALLVDSESAQAALAAASGPGLSHIPKLAYIDPGSGSFVLQALIAAVAGAAVAINAYWGKIKRMLGIGSAKSTDEDSDSGSSDA